MKVTIRPLRLEDAYVSVKWRNDPEVFKYTGNTYNKVITIENELEWIQNVMARPNDIRCAIEVDGVYVGNIYLTDIHEGVAHYHIFIGNKDYWGKGVAKQASMLIINHAFNNCKIDTILLRVQIFNERAFNLYKILGFEEIEGDDKWITMKLMQS